MNAFRAVPRTGVIYVTTEAERRGFSAADPSWCNLGQGQPETGPLAGAPARITGIDVLESDLDYAPVGGLRELREAIAALYNELFRKGRSSKYTAENVAVSGGGRVGLMRACAAVAPVHLGHFLPDYTAYAELLDVFRRFSPIPVLLDPERGYAFSADELAREIRGRGLGAILMSNPCNPTGKLIHGEELDRWVGTARAHDCTLLLDEFYSHYVWADGAPPIVSAAEFVEDVERDPIVIVDGLTKNWRYPGFRVTWVLGPSRTIEAVTSAGSFLDGGASRPMQRAALGLIEVAHARAETEAIRSVFLPKRARLVEGLRRIGVKFDLEPEATFYAWGDVSGLAAPLDSGQGFFEAALAKKVVVVPGQFFDVDPGGRRSGRAARFAKHVRFSFGPAADVIDRALERFADL